MARRRPFLSLALAAAVAGLPLAPVARAQTAGLETAVKATYLYKFAPFVVWPVDDGGPMTICVVGHDPYGVQLDRAVAGQSLAGRPFQVMRLEVISASSPCHIAFLGGSRSQSIPQAIDAVHGAPILTVTDGARQPGMIDFVMQDGRVRFRVDQQAAHDGRLEISSKLLSLALSVRQNRVMQ